MQARIVARHGLHSQAYLGCIAGAAASSTSM
jgi:hypothetical protein